MKVAALGMWHLGLVTAGCLARHGHSVIGIDGDKRVIDALNEGDLPISEPGLNELLSQQTRDGRVRFSCNFADAADADVLWLTIDTPVDENDKANVDLVEQRILEILPHLRTDADVIVSSQVLVGFTDRIAAACRKRNEHARNQFFYIAENIRLGVALATFEKQERIIIGCEDGADHTRVSELLSSFSSNLIWMSCRSAEMVKHSLNAFLALSITYINEIAAICESVGADARQVATGLLSEERIGSRAYLNPGGAFAGSTLARDVHFLCDIADGAHLVAPLIHAITESNDQHKHWAERRLQSALGSLNGKNIAVLGLTYKPGTDTLRRSSAVEFCQWLRKEGAHVRAYDPAVKKLPDDLTSIIELCSSPRAAISGASAVVVATEWPVFKELDAGELTEGMERALVLDANGHLRDRLGRAADVTYITVGSA